VLIRREKETGRGKERERDETGEREGREGIIEIGERERERW
jgi:hypothetical protein